MTSRPARSATAACFVSAVVLTLALSATGVRAESVYGIVLDRNEWPVQGLLVRLIPRAVGGVIPADDPRAANGEPVSATSTDTEGRFQFDNVTPGRYLVVAGTIRAGMNTERFTLHRGRDQALNLIIGDAIQAERIELPPIARIRPLTPEERERVEAQRAREWEEGLDPARVAARNRDILQSLDDDDDGAGPTVLLRDGSYLGPAVRRADLARRGILRDESFRDDEDDEDDIDDADDRLGDDDDRFGDDDGDRLGDGDDDSRRRVVTRGPGTATDDRDEISRADDTLGGDGTRDISRADGTSGGTSDVSRAGNSRGGAGDVSRSGKGVGNTRDISRAGANLGGGRDISRAGNDLGGGRDISRAGGDLGGTRDISRADGSTGGARDISRDDDALNSTQDISRDNGTAASGVGDVSRDREAGDRERSSNRARAAAQRSVAPEADEPSSFSRPAPGYASRSRTLRTPLTNRTRPAPLRRAPGSLSSGVRVQSSTSSTSSTSSSSSSASK